MFRIHFLASGSSGNATLIRSGTTCVLLDCGLPYRTLLSRLQEVGIRPEELTAVLLTHEHRDHIAGLRLLTRRCAVPVVLTERTAPAVPLAKKSRSEKTIIHAGKSFRTGELEVAAFRIPHDARDPVGYAFTFPDGTRLGIATDLGHPNPEAVEALQGCDLIGLETNHDPVLLRDGPYPWVLKRRICSDRGHLSNQDAAMLLDRIGSSRLRHLFGLHLSRTNNRPPLALQALTDRVRQLGLATEVAVVAQGELLSFPSPGQLALF